MGQAKIFPAIDGRWIGQTYAFRRELTEPQGVGEKWMLPGQTYGSILRDADGLWRMWYLDFPVYTEHFATSCDGVKWDLPQLNLGIQHLKGEAMLPNAIMTSPQKDADGRVLSGTMGPEGFCVLDNTMTPHPAAEARFTAMYLARWYENEGTPEQKAVRGLCIAHSEDGIHWKAGKHNPVLHGWMDTGNIFFYDTRIKKYVVYGRPNAYVNRITHANRVIGRSESEDLVNWTPFQIVLDTDDIDADPMEFLNEHVLRKGGTLDKAQQAAAWEKITEGMTQSDKPVIRGRNKQWYGMTVFPYGDIYLGVGMMFDLLSGHMWLELLHSYDGVDWRREAGRKPWLKFEKGRWDFSMQVPAASPPVRVGDEDWFYYSSTRKDHHGAVSEMDRWPGEPLRVIGACRIKQDRWAGYRAGNRKGELISQPMPGRCLGFWVNAKVEEGGELQVELCDGEGLVKEGFGFEDCAQVTGDGVRLAVTWKGGMPREGAWRFRIAAKNAVVYGVEVEWD